MAIEFSPISLEVLLLLNVTITEEDIATSLAVLVGMVRKLIAAVADFWRHVIGVEPRIVEIAVLLRLGVLI